MLFAGLSANESCPEDKTPKSPGDMHARSSSVSATTTLSSARDEAELTVAGPSEESERLRLRERRLGVLAEHAESVWLWLLLRGGATGAGQTSETRFPPSPRRDWPREWRAETGRTTFDAPRLRREKRGVSLYGVDVSQLSSLSFLQCPPRLWETVVP